MLKQYGTRRRGSVASVDYSSGLDGSTHNTSARRGLLMPLGSSPTATALSSHRGRPRTPESPPVRPPRLCACRHSENKKMHPRTQENNPAPPVRRTACTASRRRRRACTCPRACPSIPTPSGTAPSTGTDSSCTTRAPRARRTRRAAACTPRRASSLSISYASTTATAPGTSLTTSRSWTRCRTTTASSCAPHTPCRRARPRDGSPSAAA